MIKDMCGISTLCRISEPEINSDYNVELISASEIQHNILITPQ